MDIKILTTKHNDEWNALVDSLPEFQRDVHIRPQFLSNFESIQKSESICFAAKDGDSLALYPFLKSNINTIGYTLDTEYFDIQSAYGPNGIYSNNTDLQFLQNFGELFCAWCNHNKIVTELIRFNPVTRNETLSPWVETRNVLSNVLIDLSSGYESVFRNYKKSTRQVINKLKNTELEFLFIDGKDIEMKHIDWFKEVYFSTMERTDANDIYYFDSDFFESLISNLKEHICLCFVLYKDKAISTEIILLSPLIAYSYLGGTLAEYFHLNPNYFLRHMLAQHLISLGIRYSTLGGGRSRYDELYSFKKRFSYNSIEHPMFIGSKIHIPEIYNEIINQWRSKHTQLEEKYQNYILKYRYMN